VSIERSSHAQAGAVAARSCRSDSPTRPWRRDGGALIRTAQARCPTASRVHKGAVA
jgi:hypothetical protein